MRSIICLTLLISVIVGVLSQDDASQDLKPRQQYGWPPAETVTETVTVRESCAPSTVTLSVQIPCTATSRTSGLFTGTGSSASSSTSAPYGNGTSSTYPTLGTGTIPLSTAVSTGAITGSQSSSTPWGLTGTATGYPDPSSYSGIWSNSTYTAPQSYSRTSGVWGTGTGTGHYPPRPSSTGVYSNTSSTGPYPHTRSLPPGTGPTAPWGTGHPPPPPSSTGIFTNSSAVSPHSRTESAPLGTGSSMPSRSSGVYTNTTTPLTGSTTGWSGTGTGYSSGSTTSNPHPTVTPFNITSAGPTHSHQSALPHPHNGTRTWEPSSSFHIPSPPGGHSLSSQAVTFPTGGTSSSLPRPTSLVPYSNFTSTSPEPSSVLVPSYGSGGDSTTSLPVSESFSATFYSTITQTIDSTLTFTQTYAGDPSQSASSGWNTTSVLSSVAAIGHTSSALPSRSPSPSSTLALSLSTSFKTSTSPSDPAFTPWSYGEGGWGEGGYSREEERESSGREGGLSDGKKGRDDKGSPSSYRSGSRYRGKSWW